MLLIRRAGNSIQFPLLPIRRGYLLELYRGCETIVPDIVFCQLHRIGINVSRKDAVWLF
jgi:hypothetical protein